MTIITKQTLPGGHSIARRLPPTTATPTPRVPSGTTSTVAAGNLKNLAQGKPGQTAVIDRLRISGLADNANTILAIIQNADADGTLAEQLVLPFLSFNATTHTKQFVEYDIQKLGYVMQSSQTKAAVTAPQVGQYYPTSMDVCQYAVAGAETYDWDVWAKMRYVPVDAESSMSIVLGFWYFAFPLDGTPVLLAAAPGAGFQYRIHTLIVVANGATNADHKITLGSNSTPTNAVIQQWYSSPAGHGYRIQQFLTDIDVPVPENSPLYVSIGTDFAAKCAVVVGLEIAPIEQNNHLSLTGAPQ